MLFDTHAHCNFNAFENDWKEVIDDCRKKNIWMVNIGSQYPTSVKAVEIAQQYEQGVYAAVGVHPTHTHEPEHAFDYKIFSQLISSSKKVVAVGETGIDFYHSSEYFEIQKTAFVEHIRLAKEFGLALVIHGRNSKDGVLNCYKEIFTIVKKEKVQNAVVHCFLGTSEDAKAFLDLGFFIGVTGIVTFKNASALQDIVKEIIPLDQLFIETDCPYLAPEPHRGKCNQPHYVEFVARKIAELKGVSFEEVAQITSDNAKKLYLKM